MTEQAAQILAVILKLHAWRGDAAESLEARTARLMPEAVAIDIAAKTDLERALAIALPWEETKNASLVTQGRCQEMPKGERCDRGKARTVFQLHRQTCPKLWEVDEGSEEAMQIGALCAVRQLRFSARMCKGRAKTTIQGAFAGYAGRIGCEWAPAAGREQTTLRVLHMLETERANAAHKAH